MGERMGEDHAWLFGRHTYEQLLANWNAQGGPFKDPLNNIRKYVASSNPPPGSTGRTRRCCTRTFRPPWRTSRQSSGANLVIMGSGVLVGSLMAADVIDEYLLMIAPVVLGTGRRLFAGGTHASLRLVESSTTSTGVFMAIYQPARG